MAYRRPPEGHRIITLQLPTELITHVDQQAAQRTISRAAMIRQLIIADRHAADS
tara:strand:- start:1316 stop:1477 length:162 start_codon:yes stop_codon:yes gene_type:complete